MSNSNVNVTYNGIGFCGLLTIVLIVLKVINLTTISWLWVLSPLWLPAAFILVALILYLAMVLPLYIGKQVRYYKWKKKIKKT